MWSPNELLKTEKQRDILSYITLQFFPFKKVPLEHYPKGAGFSYGLFLPNVLESGKILKNAEVPAWVRSRPPGRSQKGSSGNRS